MLMVKGGIRVDQQPIRSGSKRHHNSLKPKRSGHLWNQFPLHPPYFIHEIGGLVVKKSAQKQPAGTPEEFTK